MADADVDADGGACSCSYQAESRLVNLRRFCISRSPWRKSSALDSSPLGVDLLAAFCEQDATSDLRPSSGKKQDHQKSSRSDHVDVYHVADLVRGARTSSSTRDGMAPAELANTATRLLMFLCDWQAHRCCKLARCQPAMRSVMRLRPYETILSDDCPKRSRSTRYHGLLQRFLA